MNRSRTFLFTLFVAGFLAVLGCANPADDKPEAVVGEARQSAAQAGPGVPYVFAEGSTIDFVGSKVTGQHDGGFRSFDGRILLVNGDPAASRVLVSIDTNSLWADNDRLTGHLKSPDFFDVETHPTATFESTQISRSGGGWTVTGNLDLHGVTKSIAFPATIEVQEDRVTAKAEFFIKRFDFDIAYKGKADDLIRDEVVIRLDLVALPANPA